MAISVELGESHDHGPCKCCGNMSRTVWGYLSDDDGFLLASYYVQWTLGRVADHGANIDLVVGRWGEEFSSADRFVVAVAYRLKADGPQFMIIDAAERPVAKSGKLADTALRRDQVIGSPLAAQAFAMLDAIWLGDDRIAELAGGKKPAAQ